VIPSTVLPKNGHLGVNVLGEDAFGQGVNQITPMQMLMFDNAIANNGNLMRPSIILKIVDPNGTVVQSPNFRLLDTPINDTTASQVRDGMYGVVQCGSGRFGINAIQPQLDQSPYAIIAKTGTGEVQGGKASQAWLLTQAPYQNPQLSIVYMKENGGEAGPALGPIVRAIYDDIFSKIMKIPVSPSPDPNFCVNTGLLQ